MSQDKLAQMPIVKSARVSFVETFKETKNYIDFEFSDGHLLSFRLPEDTSEGHAIVRVVNSFEPMLEALKKVERFAFNCDGDLLLQWVQGAIAKAEGEE